VLVGAARLGGLVGDFVGALAVGFFTVLVGVLCLVAMVVILRSGDAGEGMRVLRGYRSAAGLSNENRMGSGDAVS